MSLDLHIVLCLLDLHSNILILISKSPPQTTLEKHKFTF